MVAVLTEKNPTNTKPLLGSMLIIAGVLMWPLANGFAKLLYSENVITLIFYIVFLRGLVAYLSVVGGLRSNEYALMPHKLTQQIPNPKIALWRGFTGAMVNVMLLIAIQHIEISTSIAIIFMAPFMVMMVAPFFLPEQFNAAQILTIGTAVLGLLVAADPNCNTPEQIFYGIGSALIAACCMCAFIIINRKYEQDSQLAIGVSGLSYMGVAVVGLMIANMMGYAQSFVVDFGAFDGQQWLFFALAVILNPFGSITGQQGFKYTPAVLATFIVYAELFWAVGIDYYLFDGISHSSDFAGIILIAIAGFVGLYYDKEAKS